MKKNFVEIKSITKYYGKEKILDNFSLKLDKGEFFSLLGYSGSGKTTLLKIIAGLIPHDAGSIIIDGIDYSTYPPEKRKIGYVPQSLTLFPHMTVKNNILFGMKEKAHERKKAKLLELIKTGELDNKQLQKYPRQLSGGQKQRVALLRAIASEPNILLLDEPLSSLDQSLRQKLAFFLQDLVKKHEITTIHVTHDSTEAALISDSFAVLKYGVILQKDNPENIFSNPNSFEVAQSLGITNIVFSKKNEQISRINNLYNDIHNDLGHALFLLIKQSGIAFIIPEEAFSVNLIDEKEEKTIKMKVRLQSSHITLKNKVKTVFRIIGGDQPVYLSKTFEDQFEALQIIKSEELVIFINTKLIKRLTNYFP